MPSVHRMMVISLTISKVTVVQWSVQVSSPKIQSANANREELARDVSNSNNLCDHVDQVENVLTKITQSLTRVIAKFESLVNGIPYSNDAKSQQNGTDLPHVFVSSSQSEDHVKKKLSGKDSPQNVDKRVDDPV